MLLRVAVLPAKQVSEAGREYRRRQASKHGSKGADPKQLLSAAARGRGAAAACSVPRTPEVRDGCARGTASMWLAYASER